MMLYIICNKMLIENTRQKREIILATISSKYFMTLPMSVSDNPCEKAFNCDLYIIFIV